MKHLHSIINTINAQLLSLGWVSKVGGIVETVEVTQSDGSVIKVPGAPGEGDSIDLFVPDSKYNAMTYWELLDSRPGQAVSTPIVEHTVRLVFWINGERIAAPNDAITELQSKIRKCKRTVSDAVIDMRSSFLGKQVFDQWGYNEAELQLCTHPHRAGAINVVITHADKLSCHATAAIVQPSC